MKPFSFFPTASGASKTQPMSASDITRINRIRASSAAYPNIFSNPPKNISNLSLNTSEISSIRMGNTINSGIFSYRPKVQPVVIDVSKVIQSIILENVVDITPQVVNYMILDNDKITICFTNSTSFNSFNLQLFYPNLQNNSLSKNFTINKNEIISLGSNKYIFAINIESLFSLNTNPSLYKFTSLLTFKPQNNGMYITFDQNQNILAGYY